MSWALSYTGQYSIIHESFHRIALSVTYEDLQRQETIDLLQRLATVYFLHICIKVNSSVLNDQSRYKQALKHLKVIDEIEHLVSIEDNYSESESIANRGKTRKLFCTVEFPEMNENLAAFLGENDQPFHAVVVNFFNDKIKYIETINSLNLVLKKSRSPLKVGIGNVKNAIDLDWMLHILSPKSLVFVHVGIVEPPNLNLRVIDLVHSFGYNTLCSINQITIEKTSKIELLQNLSTAYDVPSDTVLLKSLLQFGIIPCVDCTCATGVEESYIETHFSRLVHPFVHRKVFVSPVKVISLHISDIHQENIATMSEDTESLVIDQHLLNMATAVASPVKLSFNVNELDPGSGCSSLHESSEIVESSAR